MAKIVLNPAIQVISGDIAGFVYRHQADGSISVARAGIRSEDYEPINYSPQPSASDAAA